MFQCVRAAAQHDNLRRFWLAELPAMQNALIVEDLPESRTWLTGVVLAAFPALRITTAARCDQALACVGQQAVDLALIDLGLPDGDGSALAAWALAQQPDLQVAIASGMGSQDAAAGLARTRALPKPFDMAELISLLDAVRQTARGASLDD